MTENTWRSTSPEICESGGLIILSFIKVAQQHELVLIMSEQPHPDKLSALPGYRPFSHTAEKQFP